MIIDINGKSLSDSCDVFLYYSKFANKELFADLMSLNSSIKKTKEGKVDVNNLINNPNFFNLFKNLYFAGRCSFEDKLISHSVLKNELTMKTLMDINFYNSMFEFIGGILPEENKKKV